MLTHKNRNNDSWHRSTKMRPWKVSPYAALALSLLASCASAAGEEMYKGSSMPRSEQTMNEPTSMPASANLVNEGTNPVPHSVTFQPSFDALLATWGAPWVRTQSEASTSQDTAAAAYEIPAFQHPSPNGLVWGPFEVGKHLFEAKPYPIHIPVFRHLYQPSDLVHANFEDFLKPDRRLATRGNLFYPEPQQLYQIQLTVWNILRAQGIRPRPVDAANQLADLLWLWPPTEIAAGQAGLQIPLVDLNDRIRKSLGFRLQQHLRPAAKVFHLRLTPVEGGIRHIMMMPVHSDNFVDLVRHPRQSELWFFYEGFVHGLVKKLAFLGAMYMPLIAEDALIRSEDFTAAFTHALAREHL